MHDAVTNFRRLMTGLAHPTRVLRSEALSATFSVATDQLVVLAGRTFIKGWTLVAAVGPGQGRQEAKLRKQAPDKSKMLQRPSDKDLASELGSAQDIWKQLIASIIERVGPVDEEWKPSKASFGWLCLLKQKKRTLVYLSPDKEFVTVSIVLGERAVAIALESQLPEAIKGLIKEARPYAEGRGIRFVLKSKTEVQVVTDLIAIKIAPK